MGKTFQIFIIFHKNIYDKCYQYISQEDLDKYFTFVAVDETITKTYTPNKYNIIKEWELPIYNPELRKNKFLENTVIYHIFANQIYKQYDFIGFFHYDMLFLNNVIEDIKSGLKSNIKAFYGKNLHPVPGEYVMHTPHFNDFIWPDESECFPILEKYEQYFHKKILKKSVYPYCNTYIIESKTFDKIMTWIITVYKTVVIDIPGVYERLMGVSIGEENTFNVVGYLDIIHDRSINVFV
jgi:hypothetical protein